MLAYATEGRTTGLRPLVTLATPTRSAIVSQPALFTGDWHTIAIQLLPDGSCGFVVDGKAIAVGGGPPPTAAFVVVGLIGNSYDTRIAVGPLTLYEGVRTDIDWNKAAVFR